MALATRKKEDAPSTVLSKDHVMECPDCGTRGEWFHMDFAIPGKHRIKCTACGGISLPGEFSIAILAGQVRFYARVKGEEDEAEAEE